MSHGRYTKCSSRCHLLSKGIILQVKWYISEMKCSVIGHLRKKFIVIGDSMCGIASFLKTCTHGLRKDKYYKRRGNSSRWFLFGKRKIPLRVKRDRGLGEFLGRVNS